MSEAIERGIEQIFEKEEWIQQTTDEICEMKDFSRKTVLSGVRWASIWVDDFRKLMYILKPTYDSEVQTLIHNARDRSLEKCEGLESFPEGGPTLRVIISAHEAFCLYFAEHTEQIRELLNLPEPEY